MAHLLDYEIAEDQATEVPTRHNFAQAALAALSCADAKNAKARAWHWANTAAQWAEKAGIVNAPSYLGNMRRPKTLPLRHLLMQLTKTTQPTEPDRTTGD